MNLPSISTAKLGLSFDTSRITTMAAPVMAIVVSVLVLILIVWPKFTGVLQLRSSNRDLEVRAGNLVTKAQILSSLDKVELTQDLGYAELLLPSDKGVFLIIRQIEVAAASSGVVLNKVDVAPGPLGQDDSAGSAGSQPQVAKSGDVAETAPKIQLKVAITSDYSSFLNFISNISAISRVTSIRDLTLSSSSSPGEKAPLRTSMVINAYWKSLPTKLGQIEAPLSNLSEAELLRINKAKLAATSAATSSAALVPLVPTGREDLFAPF